MFDSLTVYHLRICAFEVVDFYGTGTVGDIPRGVNRPEVNPTGLGGLYEDPADTWRVTGDPP